MGRIICELERIYGIKKGNNQHSSNGTNLTQEELAQKIGIDLTTYKRDKKILELIPELQEMVNTGSLTTSVASRIICELERIYGIRQGSNNPKGTNIGDTPLVGDVSQSDIAKELNTANGGNMKIEIIFQSDKGGTEFSAH